MHFHDLRHIINSLRAGTGANLRELIERMGHSTTRAALIYLHTTSERQHKIADGIGDLARDELARPWKTRPRKIASGTDLARRAERRAAGDLRARKTGA